MSVHSPGTRVGAVLSGDKDSINLLGYGVYEGDFVFGDTASTAPVGFLADGLREHGLPNPRIRLDSGQVVWGCECWWGPEDKVREMCEGREVVMVDIDARRAEYRRSEGQA